MKFCTDHWSKLRAAISTRGLDHLIAKDGASAMENMQAEIDGQASLKNYDPLMSAHWMITGRALEVGGLYLMTKKADGSQYCPLCELNQHSVGVPVGVVPSEDWINGCCDSVHQYCVENKLTIQVQ